MDLIIDFLIGIACDVCFDVVNSFVAGETTDLVVCDDCSDAISGLLTSGDAVVQSNFTPELAEQTSEFMTFSMGFMAKGGFCYGSSNNFI